MKSRLFGFVCLTIISLHLVGVCKAESSHLENVLDNPSLTDSTQLLVVQSIKGSICKARVTLWQRPNHNPNEDQEWVTAFPSMDAVVGRNGIALKGKKREGDGYTPSGIFLLKTVFGYAPSVDTRMNYRQSTNDDIWIDDPHSKNYNHWINRKDLGDAQSFERMKRDDDLYKAGLVIEYNTDPVVAGMGSAIFLHIWREGSKGTAGCVALSEENVFKILKWLDPTTHPRIVINP